MKIFDAALLLQIESNFLLIQFFWMKIQFWSSSIFEWLCISVHFKHQSNKGRKLRPTTCPLSHTHTHKHTHTFSHTLALKLMHTNTRQIPHTCTRTHSNGRTCSFSQTHTRKLQFTQIPTPTSTPSHSTQTLGLLPHSTAFVCLFATCVCNFVHRVSPSCCCCCYNLNS